MELKILVDTNILIDYILMRESFFEDANQIFRICCENVSGCIAAHSIANLFYILRRDFDAPQRREVILGLFDIFYVSGITDVQLLSALKNDSFSDFEDCLQMECAIDFGAQYIVTRNVDDFKGSAIPAITPRDFLDQV